MAGELAGQDPAQLRISDTDRHRMAEFLRDAAAEGRIDMDELDERLEAAYSAKVYADLVPLVVDLPGAAPAVPAPVVPPAQPMSTAPRPAPLAVPGTAPRYGGSIAIMSGQDRKGVWEVPANHTAFALMGGIQLDLREAVFSTREVVINANAVMGGIDIVVNAWTRVSVDGIGIMGGFEESRGKVEAQLGPDSPLVRVRGVALMGGVTVTRKPMPGEPRQRRLTRGH